MDLERLIGGIIGTYMSPRAVFVVQNGLGEVLSVHATEDSAMDVCATVIDKMLAHAPPIPKGHLNSQIRFANEHAHRSNGRYCKRFIIRGLRSSSPGE